MGLLDICEQYFSSRDLYEVFQIKKGATEKEVRKAYHKMSLLYHPDRVDESEKLEATEKFKVLGKIHTILSESMKRLAYDESGIWDEYDEDGSFDDCDWMEYWQLLFKKITLNDIEKYEKEYKGSDEEHSDLKKAYKIWKGNMDKIYESVPFLTLDDESRIRALLLGFIESKELTAYDHFINEPQNKRDRRIRKLKKEAKQAEKLSKKRKEKEREKDGMDDLNRAIFARRQLTAESFLGALEKKYTSCSGNENGGGKSQS